MIDYAATFTNYLGAFPSITAVNVSAPGAGDGTEFVAAMVNDIWGRAQALMNYGGLTPNGVQEASGTAQIITALSRGYGIGPGIGVTYWKNGTPAANGDRVLLLQGQTIAIASYSALVTACYVGDANNATAPAFYKTSDAGGTTRDTAGAYFVLPDTRAMSLKGAGSTTLKTRTKTGPVFATREEDQGQGWQLGAAEDDGGVRDTFGVVNLRYSTNGSSSANYALPNMITTGQGSTKRLKALSDGTNGTPRAGLTTRDCTIGTNFGITY
jgi:hypothetical protein